MNGAAYVERVRAAVERERRELVPLRAAVPPPGRRGRRAAGVAPPARVVVAVVILERRGVVPSQAIQ